MVGGGSLGKHTYMLTEKSRRLGEGVAKIVTAIDDDNNDIDDGATYAYDERCRFACEVGFHRY